MTRKHLSWDDSLCTGVRECALDSMEWEGRIPVDGGNYVNEVNLTSQFRLQVQCSSFSFTISLLSWLHCILLSLVYIFDSYSSSLCSAPLSPAATLCFSLLLLYLLLFLLLPFLQGSFLFLVFYIFWSNSKYMMGEQDKIMCTSSGPSRSSSCHPCA